MPNDMTGEFTSVGELVPELPSWMRRLPDGIYTWTSRTREAVSIKLCDMTDSHLANCHYWLIREARAARGDKQQRLLNAMTVIEAESNRRNLTMRAPYYATHDECYCHPNREMLNVGNNSERREYRGMFY